MKRKGGGKFRGRGKIDCLLFAGGCDIFLWKSEGEREWKKKGKLITAQIKKSVL